ncbi:p53-induced death domain-containing protein 1-like [Anneissia japonica]|uniref:p53-induced death domain-containing protein 1-like n=1 Tax=Anneissia japonica TaxID=1529436 RepID=UPI0014255134|nr:p53-induced death domain-containing protein 1-like [Anneissia japonica]
MTTRGYVMMSYQWDDQPMVKKIADRLKQHGYNVWIDIEKMHGFIFDTMADAVKNADVVLACFSEKYQQSDNCKSEGNCMRQFRKEFIPIKMEAGYSPDGWVATIFGGHLYVDFSQATDPIIFETKIYELLQQLGLKSVFRDIEAVSMPNVSSPIASATESSIQPKLLSKQDNCPLNEVVFRDLGEELGNDWRRLATFLGVPYVKQEKISAKHPGDMEEQTIAMLLEWKKATKRGDNRVDILSTALNKAGRIDLAELVEELGGT